MNAFLKLPRERTAKLGQGNFLSLEALSRQVGLVLGRAATVALFDRLPKGIRCGDCSLTPPDQRRAAYLAGLANN